MNITLRKKNVINVISFWILFSLCLVISAVGNAQLAAVIFFGIMSVAVISKFRVSGLIKLILFFSLLIRIFVVIYMFNQDIVMFPDSNQYIMDNETLIRGNDISFNRMTVLLGSLHVGYQYFIFLIYRMFNTYLSLFLANILMYFSSMFFMFEHINKRFNHKIAIEVLICSIISVNLFLFTSNILKDSLVLFLSMGAIYFYDRFKESKNKFKYIAIMIVFLLYSLMTRIYVGAAFTISIIVDYLLLNKKHFKKKNLHYVLIITLITWIILHPFLSRYYSLIGSFLTQITPSNITNFIVYIFSMIFSPLPWNMIDTVSAYTILLLDSMLLLIFSPLLVITILKLFRNQKFRKKMYFYIIPILFHIVALGTNYGTGGVRQRIAIFPFIVLFYVIGANSLKKEKLMR